MNTRYTTHKNQENGRNRDKVTSIDTFIEKNYKKIHTELSSRETAPKDAKTIKDISHIIAQTFFA